MDTPPQPWTTSDERQEFTRSWDVFALIATGPESALAEFITHARGLHQWRDPMVCDRLEDGDGVCCWVIRRRRDDGVGYQEACDVEILSATFPDLTLANVWLYPWDSQFAVTTCRAGAVVEDESVDLVEDGLADGEPTDALVEMIVDRLIDRGVPRVFFVAALDFLDWGESIP